MGILKIKVPCFRCGKDVDKIGARQLLSPTEGYRYECYSCFKKDLAPDRRAVKPPQKEIYFCGRCKYKFVSRFSVCPYCNKSDNLEKTTVTTSDLLRSV